MRSRTLIRALVAIIALLSCPVAALAITAHRPQRGARHHRVRNHRHGGVHKKVTVRASTNQAPPRAPVNTVAPKMSGSKVQGATVTATPGTWTYTPTSYAYQWQDCAAA